MSASEEKTAPPRQLPALEAGTRFFWEAGAANRLMIQRCVCGRYQHPPLPCCPVCGSEDLAPAPVSGKATVASFTINRQQWRAGLKPYVFAAVELEEQPELYVFTNVVDCPLESVYIKQPVEVAFEQHGDTWLPMFRPREA